MSSDVYFDFYSPETFVLMSAFWRADNTNGWALPLHEAWRRRVAELEAVDGPRTHYRPLRVADLGGVPQGDGTLEELMGYLGLHGSLVTPGLREEIVGRWDSLYTAALALESGQTGIDIASPAYVRKILTEHEGKHLDIRID